MLRKRKSERDSDAMCRICYRSDGSMIEPCRCKGSIAKVHRLCLETWLDYRENYTACELCSFEYKVKKPHECSLLESIKICKDISGYDGIDIWLMINRILFNIMECILVFRDTSYHTMQTLQFSTTLIVVYLGNRIGREIYDYKCAIVGFIYFLLIAHPMNIAVVKLIAPIDMLPEQNENVMMSEILGPFASIRILLSICEAALYIHRGRKLNEPWVKYGAIACLLIIFTIQRLILNTSKILAFQKINAPFDSKLFLESSINVVLDIIVLSFTYSSYKIYKFCGDWLEWHETTQFVICDLK